MKRHFFLVYCFFFFLFFSMSIESFSQNKKWFVKEGGTGDGSTWNTAMGNLQIAINSASSSDTVLVSKGSYNGGFTMKEGVQVYGGFSGTEQYTSQSLPTKNITILDGKNLYRVINQRNNFSAPTVWSGFVIQNGKVEDVQYQTTIDVGTIIYSEATNEPAGVVFKYDKASGNGLMLALEQRQLTWGGEGVDIDKLDNLESKELALLDFNGVQNTIIIAEQLGLENDYAATWCQKYEGGGFTDWYLPSCGELNIILSENYTTIKDVLITIPGATPISEDSYSTSTEKSGTNIWAQNIYGINEFSNNSPLSVLPIRALNNAGGGGGVLLQNGVLRNCIVRNNQASSLGGGVYVGKGGSLQGSWITENSGSKASGVYNLGSVINSTITNNLQNGSSASIPVGGIVVEANSTVSNTIAFGNKDIANNPANIIAGGGTISHTASNTLITGTNNKIVTSADFVGATDFHLSRSSALLKAGDISVIPSDYKTDLDGNPRKGTNQVDLGAYQALELREAIIIMNDSTVIYDGLPHTLKVVVEPNTLIPSISYKDINGVQTTTPPIKAGVYTVTALVAAQDIYLETTKTAKLTIEKATPTISLESKTDAYTGLPVSIDPAVINGPAGAEDLVISYRYTSASGYDSEQEPTNAGVYTVVAKTVATADIVSVSSAPVTLTIEKATPEIMATSKTAEYTGEPIALDAAEVIGSTTASQLLLTYSYKGVGGTNYGPSETPPTQSGSYEVTVSTVGDANHNPDSVISSLTIGKGVSVINLTAGEYIYDGTPKTLTAYVKPSTLSVTYTYEGRTVDGSLYPSSSTPPTNAGVYTVTAKTPGDLSHLPSQASARMVIHRKQSRIDMISQSVQYTGSPISTEPPVTDPSDANLVITYRGIDGTNYPETRTAPTNIGKYVVRAVYAGDSNHFGTSRTAQLTITVADVPTLILKNKTVVYNGSQHAIDPAIVEPEQAASEVLVRYFYSNQYYPMSSIAPTNAGIYTVRASTIGTNNYESAFATAYLTIQKAKQTITFEQLQLNGHYLGESPFRLTATSSSGLPVTFQSGNPSIASVSEDGNVTIHKAGSVIITASQSGDKNYQAAVSVVRTLNIGAAIPSLTLEPKTEIYTGIPISIDPGIIDGPAGAQDLEILYRYTSASGYDSDQAPTNAGVYTVAAKTVATEDFISVFSAPVTLTIEKATPEILATSKSSEYTGEPIALDVAEVTGSATASQLLLTYSYKGINGTNYGPSETPPTQSGGYEVTVSTVGDANHNPASTTASLGIGKGVATITLTGGEYVYDGTPKTLTAYVSPSTLSITYTYEGRLSDGSLYPSSSTAPTNAGVYTVTAKTPGDLSHLPSQATARLVIHRKQSRIDMLNQSVQYTGSPISTEPPVTDPSDAVLVITYKGLSDTNYPETEVAPTNVGKYVVRAVYAGDLNHFGTSRTAQLTITVADVPTLILKNKTAVYNGSQHAIDPAIVEPEQAASEALVRYFYSNQYYPMSSIAPTNAGIYTVRASTIATNNFKPAHATAYLTIQKAKQTITFEQSQLDGHYLGESPFRLTATSTSGLPVTFQSGNPSIASVSQDGDVTILKVGSVAITATQSGDRNYEPAQSVIRTLTITEITTSTPTVTLEPKTEIYTGLPISIDPVVAEGPAGAQDLDITYRYTSAAGYDSARPPTNAGVYTVVAKTIATEDFISVSSAPVTLTIEKATPEILATSKSSEYTGEPIALDVAEVTGSTTAYLLALTYTYKGINGTNYASSQTPPTLQGSYEVTVSTVGDVNHNPASSVASLNIGKGVSTITLTAGEFVYDGTPKTLIAYVNPLSLSVSYTYEGKMTDGTIYPLTNIPPINAGVYTVTAKTTGDLSHLPSQASARMVIHKKQSRIDMVNQSVQYTGSPINMTPAAVDPSYAVLVITYKGIDSTNYPESSTPPTNVGKYLVRAVYTGDSNHFGTSSTAQLTITIASVPTLILKNKTVVYNGNQHAIDPAVVLPEQAASETLVRYFYSSEYYPLSSVAPTNAGVYTVRVSTIATNNYESAFAKAYLTIKKAKQTITFDQSQLEGHSFGESSFQLTATSSSGLPVTFESGNPNIATVSPTGVVNILKTGTVTIIAHQTGDKNYEPAESVTRILNIFSTEANLFGITINGINHNILEPYVVPCSYSRNEIDVVIITDPNAIVSIEKEFPVDVTKPMVREIEFSITSQDNSQTRYYTLVIEKNFNFYDVVIQRWNNTLSVINNPVNNGGFKFTDYKWYKNGVQVGSSIYYTVGEDNQQLNEFDAYYVELTTSDSIVMRTCEGYPVLKPQGVKAYPNPLKAGEPLYLEVDFDEELIQDSEIKVYDMSGKYISNAKIVDRLTSLELPQRAGTYIVKLVRKDGFEKSLKVIVK